MAGESDIFSRPTVGQIIRRYRLEVELVQAGEWQDVQAKVFDFLDEEWPGRQIAVDLVEETLLVPDGSGERGSREAEDRPNPSPGEQLT